MNEYNALFIIDPSKESSLKEITSAITGAITKAEGRVDKEENWGRQKLSHSVKKNKEGIYYKIDFSSDPSAISTLKNNYKLNQNILRVMITKK